MKHTGCCARVRSCKCGYAFKPGDSPLSDKEPPYARRVPGYDLARLGVCPSCGTPRRLCGRKTKDNNYLCFYHSKSANARRNAPLDRALTGPVIDEIAEINASKDGVLEQEFQITMHMVQTALSSYVNAIEEAEVAIENDQIPVLPKLEVLQETMALVEKAYSIADKRQRLKNVSSVDEQLRTVKFDDPRVQWMLKEQIKQVEIDTLRGTIGFLWRLMSSDPELRERFASILPPTMSAYVIDDGEQIASGG